MNNYLLTCDTAVDLDREYLEERGSPFISFHYTIDEVDFEDDLGRTVTYEEFYKKLDNGALPTTSQINIADSIDFFEPFLKEGKDIIHLAFSSGLSGTYNCAKNAAIQSYDGTY